MAALRACPGCGSRLIQPLRSEQGPHGSTTVELRCPECFAILRGSFSEQDVAALDRAQIAARATLVTAYERCVTESMEALADCLAEALALDLVGADDFAPRRLPVPRTVSLRPPPAGS